MISPPLTLLVAIKKTKNLQEEVDDTAPENGLEK